MNISKTWDVDPMDFIPEVTDTYKNQVVGLAKRVFDGVVSRTPVYTGNLRASWVAAPFEDYSVKIGGSKENQLPPPTFPSELFSLLPDVIYVMNSTSYAGLVEFGGPKNVPRAMVQLTINSL